MKKQVKFSVQEKHVIRSLIAYLLAQLVIISFFVYAFIDSLPVDSDEIKQVDIVVEDTFYFRFLNSYWLIVYSDSSDFLFSSGFTRSKEYSVSEINKSISNGDNLSLMYYKDMTVIGEMNIVVDAKSGSSVYRSIEAHNDREKTAPLFPVIMFPIVELIFGLYMFIMIRLQTKTIKKILAKTKKRIR